MNARICIQNGSNVPESTGGKKLLIKAKKNALKALTISNLYLAASKTTLVSNNQYGDGQNDVSAVIRSELLRIYIR